MASLKEQELTRDDKLEMVSMLLAFEQFGGLPHGIQTRMAKKFGVSARTVRRVWSAAKASRANGRVILGEIEKNTMNRGTPNRRFFVEDVQKAIQEIPFRMRSTWADLAMALGMSERSLRRMDGQGLFRHSSPLKPYLKDFHKVWRIEHALGHVDGNTGMFKSMYDEVHVDEKWFYMTQDGRVFILANGEEPPKRKVQHKSHITKVMFLCAQARPRVVNGVFWDGKVGLFPIGQYDVARRSSCNRPAGARVWRDENMNRERYKDCLLNKVLPSIMANFPWSYLGHPSRRVVIQQDGASAHLDEDDEDFKANVEALGVNVVLRTQPAQSPDLNINDLGFFRAIMSLQKKEAPRNAMELIASVQKAYTDYPPHKINRLFLTLQQVFNEILLDDGGNDYSLPHMGKESLERAGNLPTTIAVDERNIAKYNIPKQPETTAGTPRTVTV